MRARLTSRSTGKNHAPETPRAARGHGMQRAPCVVRQALPAVGPQRQIDQPRAGEHGGLRIGVDRAVAIHGELQRAVTGQLLREMFGQRFEAAVARRHAGAADHGNADPPGCCGCLHGRSGNIISASPSSTSPV
jgi:hypothetical protein